MDHSLFFDNLIISFPDHAPTVLSVALVGRRKTVHFGSTLDTELVHMIWTISFIIISAINENENISLPKNSMIEIWIIKHTVYYFVIFITE